MARIWSEAIGCKVSRADADALLRGLVAAGHCAATDPGDADLAVVTTCCVTAEAERSSRQRVHRLSRLGIPVVVTGCAVTYRPEQFEADGVVTRAWEAVPAAVAHLSSGRHASLPAAQAAAGTKGSAVRTRYTLKVQDGCNACCTYCAVRLVRGPLWSLDVASALAEARRAVAEGCGEVVVSGINLGLYRGRRGDGYADLPGLISLLVDVPGLARLRVSSVEPLHVGVPLLRAMAHPLVAQHLHIPLQSADDAVLRAMRRPYTFAEYRELLDLVHEYLPETMITSDVIVGFPGESTAAFERTLAAIDDAAGLFGRVHVFTFSRRPGTVAAMLEAVAPAELRRRRTLALAAARRTLTAAAARYVGRRVEVLVEDCHDGRSRGYSSQYVRCYVPEQVRRGTLVSVVGVALQRDGLLCATVDETRASNGSGLQRGEAR